MIKPLYDNVLLKVDKKDQKTKSGIIISNDLELKSQTARIVALGEECENMKYGQQVVFKKFCGTEIEYNDVKYLIIKKDDILCLIEEGDQIVTQ